MKYTSVWCIAACLAFAGSAFAQGLDVSFGALSDASSDDIEVSADSLAIDQKTGQAEFEGNVDIGRGDLRLSADKVTIIYLSDNSGIERFRASGNVMLVAGPDAAEADEADYDLSGQRLVMSGNVLLAQGALAVSADKMNIDLETGAAQMTGRVKTILAPDGQ